ncbi:glycosyltransferase WbuB [Steroidobacter agaridevorans]|uniref:Glycosyltransferase WbuB n=1 Tax=Steroidobacter agaridevorans TaxID=2695856 RepID=A0A829YFM5_9GAMM|nr:glycosyltransferase family 4 protein [Steroidobacter agaridevorans]GFE82030.1 glycosyltransferase WbuB [Steroidobacter agaridevorans]GFE85581.1 glycosyltransferase WbuB [Steroidobacter agaridevorans]
MIQTQTDKRPRVVIVSEFVDATRNSTGYYWRKIIEGLARAGSEVVVVSTEQSCALAAPFGPNISCRSTALGQHSRNGGVKSYLFGQVQLALGLALQTWRVLRRGDVLYCGTNPSFLLVILALFRLMLGFRWVLLVHDVFPENAAAAGLTSPRSLKYRLAKAVFDRTYSAADALIAIGQDMLEVLQRKTRGKAQIEVIPNWADVREISTSLSPDDKPMVDRSRADAVIFQYFGNFGRVQGLELLLDAIRMVEHPAAEFVFIGDGALAGQVQQFVAQHPERRVRCLPSLEFGRNNEGLLACDVAMISLMPGMFGLAVPSKAYFSMAADKPLLVIGDVGAELQKMVSDHKELGWFCPAGDPRALARLIEQICDFDLSSIRGCPRRFMERNHDWKQAIRRYVAVLWPDTCR